MIACRSAARPLGRSVLEVSVTSDDDPSSSCNHRDPSRVFRLGLDRALNPRVAVGADSSWIARVGDVRAHCHEQLCEAKQIRVDVKADGHNS
jgi:hypothetical protein